MNLVSKFSFEPSVHKIMDQGGGPPPYSPRAWQCHDVGGLNYVSFWIGFYIQVWWYQIIRGNKNWAPWAGSFETSLVERWSFINFVAAPKTSNLAITVTPLGCFHHSFVWNKLHHPIVITDVVVISNILPFVLLQPKFYYPLKL